jgi:lipoprotein-releasing system permease protein
MEGVLLKGLDSTYDIKNIRPFLKQGRWLQFNDSSYTREVVISTFTANQLRIKLNDRMLLYFVRADGTLRPDKLTIVGIYKTGIEDFDKIFALGDIKLIRRLNGWKENEIGGYEIFLKDYHQMKNVSESIYYDNSFPPLWVTKTTAEIYPYIFDWLNIISYNGRILIVIVTAIVIINFITCLIILVLERVKMIGIMKAIGASNWAIQKIFLYHSALITFAGILIGTAISIGLLWLQIKTGFVKLKEDQYFIDTAAVSINWNQVLMVIGATLLISILVLLIPSFLVRKIQPIKAIRFN